MSIDALTGEIADSPTDPLDRERMRADVAESDLRLAEEEIRTLRRALGAARGQLSKQTSMDSNMRTATRIALYYTERLGKTKSWKFGDKRQKAVLARLREEVDPVLICRAIDWIAVGAYVNPDTGQKYDDLELICRNEVNVERYADLAEKNRTPTRVSDEFRRELGGMGRSQLTTSENDPSVQDARTTRSGGTLEAKEGDTE